MSIKDILKKIKPYWSNRVIPLISKVKENLDIKEDTFIVLAIVLIGLAGFGLGKLSALEKSRGVVEINSANFIPLASSSKSISNSSVTVKSDTIPLSASAMVVGENAKGFLVASKSGKKYHFPWCTGALQIAEKNKIWFDSYPEALSAGYTPASNCPGLK